MFFSSYCYKQEVKATGQQKANDGKDRGKPTKPATTKIPISLSNHCYSNYTQSCLTVRVRLVLASIHAPKKCRKDEASLFTNCLFSQSSSIGFFSVSSLRQNISDVE